MVNANERGYMPDLEKGDLSTHSTCNELEHSDVHTTETRLRKEEGASGVPDIEDEETLETDLGHQMLAPALGTEEHEPVSKEDHILHRTTTQQSGRSAKSKLSRVATNMTRKSKKKERMDRELVPEMNLDEGVVGWEGQDDPQMPLNFPDGRKWLLLSLLSSITFIAPLASSMFAPAVSFMDEEFGNTDLITSALTVSIFVLGFAVGPLFLSPLSEIYGRRIVLTCANAFFVIWQLGCALAPSINALTAFRFFAGVGGSGCLTIGGGVIADLFRADQRGLATSLYSVGPLFGPVLGPVAGGFIGERIGWRWVFWILLIAGGAVAISIEFFTTETNPRVLIHKKVLKLRKELNRPELRSCYDTADISKLSKGAILRNGFLRPIKMLFLSPIIFLLSLYMAVVYGLLYLLFTTISGIYTSTYGWQPELTGLAFIPLGIGFFLGLAAVAKISDKTVVRMTKANDGVFEPEMRLPACVIFACFVPVSFFWYGWAADYQVQWIVPIIGLAPFGFGMMGIFIPIQTYLIDSFPAFAASAVAALTVSRSLFGALLPLVAPSMYGRLGLGWGNSVLGFIAVALIPAPLLIYKYGEKIRKGYPVKL